MCRILVDCDDNTLSRHMVGEEEERPRRRGKPATGKLFEGMETPPTTPGTGTVAVAHCWRDIVYAEVSKVSLSHARVKTSVHSPSLLHLVLRFFSCSAWNLQPYSVPSC